MKYIMTFENYQTYSMYKNTRDIDDLRKSLKEDAIISIKRLLPTFDEKWIDSIEDVSVENKGIKFEIKVGKDLIHMYKIGKFIQDWEYYLNKKKITKYQLQKELEKRHLTDLEVFLKYAPNYDFFSSYINDGGAYKKITTSNNKILKMFKDLNKSDKKKAIRFLNKEFNKNEVKKIFKI